MPTVSSQVALGDIADGALVNGAAVYNNVIGKFYGLIVGKGGFDFHGYLGRFELEIPEGSTIDSVLFRWTRAGTATPLIASNVIGGFLVDDAKWDLTGFNATNYPNRVNVPWPAVWSGGSRVAQYAFYQGSAPGFSATYTPATSGTQTFGDGIAANVTATGLVAQLQAFLDSSPPRTGTVSGTAIPVAMHMGGADSLVTNQTFYASETGVEADRPFLSVAYTEPSEGIIVSRADFVAALRSGGELVSAIDSRANGLPALRTR